MSAIDPAVIWALTGDNAAMTAVASSAGDGPPQSSGVRVIGAIPDDVDDLLEVLAARGWSAERVRARAEAAQSVALPWPTPLPSATLRAIGAARWYAIVTALETALGLGPEPLPPSNRTDLTADERRLMAEVPPHHGPVG